MTTTMEQRIVILDGHDGGGKTTLAHLLADYIDGRYVKPFNGSLGDMIAWLWNRKQFEFADYLARAAVEKVLNENSDAKLLVFDRHWLSMFTVLPEEYYRNWFPLPVTILCWANVETTCRRLMERNESVGEIAKHEHYCTLYKMLAHRFEVPVIETTQSTTEEALELLLAQPLLQTFTSSPNAAGMEFPVEGQTGFGH